jgi:hypothetical protein
MPSRAEIERTLQGLRRTPRLFRTVAADRADAELGRRPEEGSWSVLEVLAHLRGAADVQGGWIARMLAEGTPTIRYASPRTGMKRTGFEQADFSPFLHTFEVQRRDLVKALASLGADGWSRTATFTGTPRPWTPSVFEIARGLATHEQSHAEQIEAAGIRS